MEGRAYGYVKDPEPKPANRSADAEHPRTKRIDKTKPNPSTDSASEGVGQGRVHRRERWRAGRAVIQVLTTISCRSRPADVGPPARTRGRIGQAIVLRHFGAHNVFLTPFLQRVRCSRRRKPWQRGAARSRFQRRYNIVRTMNWVIPTMLLFALAISTSADAQNAGDARERWGLGNSAASGLGRNASKALPLAEPNSRRHQNSNKPDWEPRPSVNPFVGRRK